MTLTTHAAAGFNGDENTHIPSSASFYAHAVGAYLQKTGRTMPRDVRMGRGYSIRANDMLFKIGGKGLNITFERTQ